MPTVSEFWDGRAQNYDAQVGTHYAEAYEKTAACFKKYLKPTDTVLDFACGTGIVTFAVASSVQSVRAIDVSGEMVRRAQEKVKAQGSVRRLPCRGIFQCGAGLQCVALHRRSERGACAHPRALEAAGNAAAGIGLSGRGAHARASAQVVRIQDRQTPLRCI